MAPHIKAAGEDGARHGARPRRSGQKPRPGPRTPAPAPQSRPISGDPGVGSAAARPSVGRQRKASTSRLQLHQKRAHANCRYADTPMSYTHYLLKGRPAVPGCTEKFTQLFIKPMEKGDIYTRTHATRTDAPHTRASQHGSRSPAGHLETDKHVLAA